MFRISFGVIVWSSALALFGCGSSSTEMDVPKPTNYVQIFDQVSSDSSDLVGHSFEPGDASTSPENGSLDRATGRFVLGSHSGLANSDRTQVVLDAGGIITISQNATDFVATFSSQPVAYSPSFGVFGIATHVSEIPSSGSASFTGSAEMQILDGTVVYDLSGIANLSSDFDANSIDVTINSLSGLRIGSGGSTTSVADPVEILVTNASIAGNSYSGGSVSLANSSLAGSLSGSESVTNLGNFFGPNYDEVGGILVVDDSASGPLLILQGTYVAD